MASSSISRANEWLTNESFLRMADAFPSMVWISETDGNCSFLSQRWFDITGQPKEKALGFGWLDAVHPDDRKHAEEEFTKATRDHSRFYITYRLRQFNGEYRWVNDLGSPRFDADGKFEGFIGSINDVHEEILSKEQLRIALEGSDMGFFDFFPQSGKLIWSERTRHLYGLPSGEEPQLAHYESILHPDDRERVLNNVKQVFKKENGGKYFNEYRVIHPVDKRVRWIRSTGKCYFDGDGMPERFSGIVQDITKEKEAMQSLLLQSMVLEQMDEGVSITDEHGIIQFTNSAEDRMFGYERGELIGKPVTIQNAYNEEENTRIVGKVIEQLQAQGSWSGEWNNIRKDGTLFFTFSFISKIVIESKTYFVCVQRDITTEKRFKEGLEASEKRFKHMFEGAPVSIWEEDFSAVKEKVVELWNQGVRDMEAYYSTREEELQELVRSVIIIDVNQASLQLMEADSKEQLKEGLQNIFIENTTYAFKKELNVIANGGGRFEYETKLKTLRGKVFEALAHVNFPPLHESYKNVMVTLIDISIRKQVEEMLEKTVQERTMELQRSNQDLQQFGHVISHDLKEPVRKIITFANRLNYELASNMSDSVKLYIDKILSSGQRMTHMIDGVLSYSMIDSSQDEQELIDLNAIVDDIKKDLDLLLHEQHVTIKAEKLPPVRGIRIHIYQVFYNLINNSIKFRKQDEDPVIWIRSERDEDNNMVKILLQDNGIGFDQQYAGMIFKAFQRLHPKSRYEGTGLGLALCQKIIERHGGKIEARSEAGKGATFIIHLPL
jgi:PAS domain S-box-containing protein